MIRCMADIKLSIGLYQVIYEMYRPVSGEICDTAIRYEVYVHEKHPAYTKAKAKDNKEKDATTKKGGRLMKVVSKGLSSGQRNDFICAFIVKDLESLSTTEWPHSRAMICRLTGKPNFQCSGVKTMV